MRLEAILLNCWYGRVACGWALAPLSLLYRFGLLFAGHRAERLPVPVIVVGNITVGGTGKTPLVLWLAKALREAGYRPGIISRGYGGERDQARPVWVNDMASAVGDEPLLLVRESGCPVWVGRRRVEVGQGLLARNPQVDVLISDDGLQHAQLGRDIEIVVIDGARGLGNGHLLPWGPLRESVRRLSRVDAVVVNGELQRPLPDIAAPRYGMRLQGDVLENLAEPGIRRPVTDFLGRELTAIAGIGNPARFFASLRSLGLTVRGRAFPDHHAFEPRDIPTGTVLMTAKYAVKCAPFAHADCWQLRVEAVPESGLLPLILGKLAHLFHKDTSHGLETA